MAGLSLKNMTKTYEDGFTAVDNISLSIEPGSFVVLVGPSGCGKSTTLRMIAGLESITKGELKIGDRVVNTVRPRDRDIAMVFQNYALYPHLSVGDNMGFSLRMSGVPKAERTKSVAHAASMLGLESILDKKPGQLSGGQRQRVALGRAIVREPAVFLFDEPLSNLDPDRRISTRAEIRRIVRDLGTTTVYVTHDHEEAMALGDVVVVMNNGIIEQAGPPDLIYEKPDTLFVARFLGSPKMNAIECSVETQGDSQRATRGPLSIDLSKAVGLPELASGDRVTVGMRPQHITLGAGTNGHIALGEASITDIERLGFATDLTLRLGEDEMIVRTTTMEGWTIGQSHPMHIDPANLRCFKS
jgi:multiple sugar transport system ATP-binding protein